jgi:hypothetical protein
MTLPEVKLALNPYEPPRACEAGEQVDVILEQTEAFFRRVMALLSFATATILGAVGVGGVVVLLATPMTGRATGPEFFILWAILNVPSMMVMGVGLLHRRQRYSAGGLTFMVISGALIALVGSLS